MAKICCIFSGVCAYFYIILRISSADAWSDRYFYQTGSPYHRSEGPLDFAPHVHRLERRDAPPPPPRSINNKTNATNGTGPDSPILPTKNPFPHPAALNITNVVPIKNLGVNGTGQRKYPTTIKPQLGISVDPSSKDKMTDDEVDDMLNESDPQKFNKTLTSHNITQYKADPNPYYNTTFSVDKKMAEHYWVNMDNRTDVKTNELLSDSHRRAATVKLDFEFPFYGHLIKSVTIATGGFIYTGEYVHSWLAATQYIAPLMANFDTSISNDSYIKYVDNGTAFTVEWEKVNLQDNKKEGTFTFQATLHKNGDVVFVYKDIPVFIKDINDDYHPVKVGLSDAYILDHTVYFVRRKTIYEYHRVNFSHDEIRNWTVIYLSALPTCLDSKDCESCLLTTKPLACSWCPTTQRCSSGTDRHRQSWMTKNCDFYQVKNASMCHTANTMVSESEAEVKHDAPTINHINNIPSGLASSDSRSGDKMGMSGIVAILFMVCASCGLVLWVLYAYRNPHTTSGQILIKYRPSQWHWRRGEARYTAATIHM